MSKPYTRHRDKGRQRLVSAVINFSDSTVTLGVLDVGDVVAQCWVEVITAFNAGTTNVLTLGTAADDDYYLAAADITEGTPAVYPTGGKGPYRAEPTADAVIAKYAKTGTAPSTGKAKCYALIVSTG